jgi:hypothetical protein
MTAPAINPYASIPVSAVTSRYRLGKSLVEDAGDLWFNHTMDDGTIFVFEEPDAWEGLDFVTPIDLAGGRDGGLDGPPSVGPRHLEIRGAMVSPNSQILAQRIRQLRSMLGPRKTVVWDQFDKGVQKRIGLICRVEGTFKTPKAYGHDQVAAVVEFNLVASNPWKFQAGPVSPQCVGLATGVVSGRTYNKTYNWNYGASGNPGGTMNVVNDGDLEAWPTFQITGPVDQPIVTNETTGQAFLVALDVPAGVTVTINSRTGVISPSVFRLIGRPWSLAPGVNTVRWRANSGSYTPAAQLCLTWRSTWE